LLKIKYEQNAWASTVIFFLHEPVDVFIILSIIFASGLLGFVNMLDIYSMAGQS